ncbi:MAG TPA: hypothetical protein VK465_05810, partial [Fibrobacteria bacterium]|nr:hypothetical protein [Fibrobacteria bacterium]
FSSNMHDTAHSVYDVFARVPGDSILHRATRVRGQALEPVTRDGILYYQGFHRQQVKFSRVPLALERTGTVLSAPVDTVPRAKPKKVDWTKHLETGEPYGPKFAQEIYPYLVLRPQILTNNRIYTDVALGVNATFGGPTGNWSQTVGGDISKRADLTDPLSYSLFYAGYLSGQPIRHTRQTWHPSLSYYLAHDMVEVEDVLRSRGFEVNPATSDTFDINDRIVLDGRYLRNYAQGYVPLPYNFGVDAGFFRQTATESYTRKYVMTQRTAGDQVVFDTTFSVKLLQDAPEHRHFNTGLGWSWSKGMVGTWLPTGVGVFTGVRKWWVNYAEDDLQVDSLFRQLQAEAGRPDAELVLKQAQFNPWSLDLGVAGALSQGRLFTLFGNLEAGTFLNKFPMDERNAHWNGAQIVRGRETAQYLWVLPYQLGGFFQMPGYPYNFRYRGRDIMEGTSMARGQVGVRIPVPFGFFIPTLPLTSFREFSVTAVMNGGTTLISAPDRILSDLEDGMHHLLLDYGARLNWNFRIYHQYPFSFYLQGFRPYNRLRANNLFWFDYPHTGPA